MKKENVKEYKMYYIDFKYTNDTYFKGVVKTDDYSKIHDHDEELLLVRIVHTFDTSSSAWYPGWSFYIAYDTVKYEVTPETHPEFYI
jgi:hypothetical protein